MSLWDITTWHGSKKIRQLDWPKDTYFVVWCYHYPESVEGFLHDGDRRFHYGFAFGGRSRWEVLE